MLEIKTCSGECVVIETRLPCSFESESGGKKRQTGKWWRRCAEEEQKRRKRLIAKQKEEGVLTSTGSSVIK